MLKVSVSSLAGPLPGLFPRVMVFVALMLGLATGCSAGASVEGAVSAPEEPTLAPTAIPTATPQPPPTVTPTATPRPSPTPTATPRPSPTPTATPVALLTEAPWKVLEPAAFVTFNEQAVEKHDYRQTYEAPAPFRYVTLTYTYPTGEELEYPIYSATFFGNPTALMVVEGGPDDEFVRVLAPTRPVGTNAWIKNKDLVWATTDRSLHIFLDEAALEFYAGAELQVAMPVQVGAADTPTPTGFTWVDEIIVPTENGYGERIFSLAIFSEVLGPWGEEEGLPKISINGDVQIYSSNKGGIRTSNADLAKLIGQVEVGTPVHIWATRADFETEVDASRN